MDPQGVPAQPVKVQSGVVLGIKIAVGIVLGLLLLTVGSCFACGMIGSLIAGSK